MKKNIQANRQTQTQFKKVTSTVGRKPAKKINFKALDGAFSFGEHRPRGL